MIFDLTSFSLPQERDLKLDSYTTESAFNFSKLTIETLEQGVKYV